MRTRKYVLRIAVGGLWRYYNPNKPYQSTLYLEDAKVFDNLRDIPQHLMDNPEIKIKVIK